MRAHLGRALPVHDAGGNVSMWVGTFTDITGEAQRMRCQAELVQAALHMCGPLAGSVSIGETLQGLLDTGRSVTGAPSVRLVVASHGVLQEPLEFRSPALEGFDADVHPLPEHIGTPPGLQRKADGPMRPSVPEHGDGELQIPLAGSDGRPMGSLAYALPSAGFSQEENTAALQLAAMVTASLEGWRLRQALAEAERQKDTFLAMLAHELRNPLAPLRAGLAILRISEPESDIALQARDMMERQLGHMVRLIDDLMDLERVTQGKIELRKERVELTYALRLAMETCGPAIEEGGHRLRVEVPERPLYVEADITRCSQLLANVLGNAAKFTPRGGVIEVRLARQGARRS
ncbi:MAG: HAMP domain-containing histidine kinase [Betaproteobacteria bacterium]|nr:HAMP domain-containing histidine kinase [Betaproteobacteria bacterium]